MVNEGMFYRFVRSATSTNKTESFLLENVVYPKKRGGGQLNEKILKRIHGTECIPHNFRFCRQQIQLLGIHGELESH